MSPPGWGGDINREYGHIGNVLNIYNLL
jgi:hypothetical protein